MIASKNGPRSISGNLTNEQAVVLAVAQLGGQFRPVETEDVAIKADQIAPKRFRWRKHPQYINNELVHTSLRDAKRVSQLLMGSGTKGWQLTADGVAFIQRAEAGGRTSTPARDAMAPAQRARVARERERILGDEAFCKATSGKLEEISPQEAERVFRIDDYVLGQSRREKMQRVLNLFADDPHIGTALRALADKVREK